MIRAYHLYAAGNAARSLNPCSALANRSLAVSFAKAENSRLVKATGRRCFLIQARPLLPACTMVFSSAFTHPAEWHHLRRTGEIMSQQAILLADLGLGDSGKGTLI